MVAVSNKSVCVCVWGGGGGGAESPLSDSPPVAAMPYLLQSLYMTHHCVVQVIIRLY